MFHVTLFNKWLSFNTISLNIFDRVPVVKGTRSLCVFVEYVKDITMQGFMILANIGTEKHTLVFYSI